jgi:hypothetical protein
LDVDARLGSELADAHEGSLNLIGRYKVKSFNRDIRFHLQCLAECRAYGAGI